MDCYAEFQFVGLYFRQYLNGTLLAYEDTNNLETIADNAFAGETNLVSVSMPNLLAVPERGFAGCISLTAVSLPKVIAVNKESFYYCSAMPSLRLPEMTIINYGEVFQWMNSLRELRIPKNTSSIGNSTILICNNLELLDIGCPTEIGASLNSNNFTSLATMILRTTSQVVTPYSSPIFSANSSIAKGSGKILVPRSMVASYKADSSWGAYSDVIYAIEDFPEICE